MKKKPGVQAKAEYDRKRYLEKKDRIIAAAKAWYENNKVRVLVKQKSWKKKNHDRVMAKQAIWKKENHDKVIESSRKRAIERRAELRLRGSIYRANHPGKTAEASRLWREANRDAVLAYGKLWVAIRTGLIIPPDKCGCGNSPVHGHHEDYAKPLSVEWLCASCHRIVHSQKRCSNA